MVKWEYDAVTTTYPITKEELDELGEDGWELVDMLRNVREGYFLNYLKRVKLDG